MFLEKKFIESSTITIDVTGIIFHFSLSFFIFRIQLMKFVGRYVQGERIAHRSEKLLREWVARVVFWNVWRIQERKREKNRI